MSRKFSPFALLTLLLFFTFLIRLWNLTAQSVWVDEGFSWFTTQADVWALLRSDVHPPLYFLVLSGWVGIVGDSELGLRYLSLLCGMLSTAMVAALAKEIRARLNLGKSGQWFAVVAVFFFALSDMETYIAQEARPYTLHVLLACMSVWGLLHFERTGRRNAWLVWLLSSIALPYTQYYGAWLLIVQGLYVLACWRGRRFWMGFGTLAMTLLAFAPWIFGMILPYQLQAGSAHIPTDLSNLATILRYLQAYFSGQWVIFGGVALVGLGIFQQRTRHPTLAFLWGWLLIPFAITFAINLVDANYLFDYRISQITPAVALLIALGWTRFPRFAANFLLVGALIHGLIYVDAYRYKEDWRGFSQEIASYVLREDTVVVDFKGGDYQMSYYLQRHLSAETTLASLRQKLQVSPQTYEADALAILDAAQTIWLVRWNDGGDALDKLAFTEHIQTGDIPIATDNNMNIRLLRFDRGTTNSLGMFENGMVLISAAIHPQTLQANLVWQTERSLNESYTTSVLLLDSRGEVVAQLDSVPFLPTNQWQTNTPIWDGKQLVTLSGQALPEGDYQLAVQVYLWVTNGITRVLLADGNTLLRLEKFRIPSR